MIAKKGESIVDLERLASELGIADKVWFADWMSPEEFPRYLSAADICGEPDPSNPYNDRFAMIKMMEYVIMGKPMVAFDLPDHRVSDADAAV